MSNINDSFYVYRKLKAESGPEVILTDSYFMFDLVLFSISLEKRNYNYSLIIRNNAGVIIYNPILTKEDLPVFEGWKRAATEYVDTEAVRNLLDAFVVELYNAESNRLDIISKSYCDKLYNLIKLDPSSMMKETLYRFQEIRTDSKDWTIEKL